MRFGTFFFFQAAPGLTHADVVHRELEQMEWTEELGFDQIWLTEHHFIDYGLAVDPASLASAAASRTRRVRIGLAAAILPFHHPLRLAEQMALIDIISKGRLDVGVGRGNRPAEFKGYHVPQQENRERFDETIDISDEVERAKAFAAEQLALGLDRIMVSSLWVDARRRRPAVSVARTRGWCAGAGGMMLSFQLPASSFQLPAAGCQLAVPSFQADGGSHPLQHRESA